MKKQTITLVNRLNHGLMSYCSLCLVTLLLCLSGLAHANEVVGQVVGVSDGDTITLLDSNKIQYKIRLAGIDAPEKNQPFGQASKNSLSDLIFDKRVTVLWEKRDRYQRIIGKVILVDQDICFEQVRRGMAWHYKQYEREQTNEDRSKYSLAEKEARENKIGLWLDNAPIEPSKFRRSK